jgi:lipopolysaccharide transport system ATP-binding protein
LGLSYRQINDRIDKIVDFAELSEAIDSPVRNYSSGMQVRLGFSSAINLNQPDVLLLDEVLAVGDIGFTIKCLNAMRELTEKCAVLFVTHSMQFVTTFCTHAMLMSNGRMDMLSSDLGLVIDKYHKCFSLAESISGSGEAVIHSISMNVHGSDLSAEAHLAVPHGQEVEMQLDVESTKSATLRVYIMSQGLVPILGSQIVGTDGRAVTIPPGRHSLRFSLGHIDFNAGLYPLVIALGDVETGKTLTRHEGTASIRVQNDGVDWGFISRQFRALDVKPAV